MGHSFKYDFVLEVAKLVEDDLVVEIWNEPTLIALIVGE